MGADEDGAAGDGRVAAEPWPPLVHPPASRSATTPAAAERARDRTCAQPEGTGEADGAALTVADVGDGVAVGDATGALRVGRGEERVGLGVGDGVWLGLAFGVEVRVGAGVWTAAFSAGVGRTSR
jgi:hypothetical protein